MRFVLAGFLHTSPDGCRIKTIKKAGHGNKLENTNPPSSFTFPFEILLKKKKSHREIIGDLGDGRTGSMDALGNVSGLWEVLELIQLIWMY